MNIAMDVRTLCVVLYISVKVLSGHEGKGSSYQADPHMDTLVREEPVHEGVLVREGVRVPLCRSNLFLLRRKGRTGIVARSAHDALGMRGRVESRRLLEHGRPGGLRFRGGGGMPADTL